MESLVTGKMREMASSLNAAVREGIANYRGLPDGATSGCSAAQPAPVTAIPGGLLQGSMDGRLRAYEAKDGRIIRDFDTLCLRSGTGKIAPW